MDGKPAYTIVPPSPPVRAVQDEWGMFDPNQAGLTAAFKAVRALNSEAAEDAAAKSPEAIVPQVVTVARGNAGAPARGAESVVGADLLNELDATVRGTGAARARTAGPRTAPHPASSEQVYDLSETETAQARPRQERGAVYSLEFTSRCPQCCAEINTVRVSRLLRTQVTFTSTLPRKGYMIVCPECNGILSAELSGLL